jgi:hypothetical protein
MAARKRDGSGYPKVCIGIASLLREWKLRTMPPMKVKKFFTPLAVLVIATGVLAGCATSNQLAPKASANCPTMENVAFVPPTKMVQAAMTPAQALERLKTGNGRDV